MKKYIQDGILVNVRSDGRVNKEVRPKSSQLGYLIYTSGSCKVKGETTIYTGITLQLQNKPRFQIKIQSIKKTQSDKQKASYLETLLEQLYDIDMKNLWISEKKAFVLNIDVFMLSEINEAHIELIAFSIQNAILDLKFPEIKVTQNLLTSDEEYELQENKFQKIQLKIPNISVIGQVGLQLVKDLTFDEFFAVEKKYIISKGEKLQVRQYEKIFEAFDSDDFLRVVQFV